MKITFGLTLLLGLLAAVGPISTDIYLPAFTLLDHDFGRIGAAQVTLGAWFAGLAIGQLIQGPLSDRIGRRRPLFYSTLIYSVASVGCAVAQHLETFSVFRVLAALGGSAGMVVPRALIRDVSDGLVAARLLSRLTLILGVVPILAPALGGIMMQVFSWRDLFWFAALYGIICTALIWRFLPDTLPPERRLHHTPSEILYRFVLILREPVFAGNTLMIGFAFAALFGYVASSASVYTSYFHLSPAQYGLLFGVNACGYIGFTQLATRCAAAFGLDRSVRLAARTLFGSYTVAALIAFAHLDNLLALAIPIFVGQAAMGVLFPLCIVSALTPHRAHAGSASAMIGTLQYGLAAGAGLLAGFINNGTPRPMTVLMVVLTAAVVLIDRRRPAISLG